MLSAVWLEGTAARNHSVDCRARLEMEMSRDEDDAELLRRRDARLHEEVANDIEKETENSGRAVP